MKKFNNTFSANELKALTIEQKNAIVNEHYFDVVGDTSDPFEDDCFDEGEMIGRAQLFYANQPEFFGAEYLGQVELEPEDVVLSAGDGQWAMQALTLLEDEGLADDLIVNEDDQIWVTPSGYVFHKAA